MENSDNNTETSIQTEENKKRKVSFSQFSNWFNCPHKWYLDYVKKLKVSESSINTCFGTAIHETFQLYIKTLYENSALEADKIDLLQTMKDVFNRELEKELVVYQKEEHKEFMSDGEEIINTFKNIGNRIKHFPANKFELVSIEDEIITPIKNNVEFIAYIDVVLKEKLTGRYKIIDIKTSRMGWNQYQKEDPAKYYQILIYKAFFSRKYNIPVDKIDVEFFIVKRKLFENYAFPQSRIQTFVPKHNNKTMTDVLNNFAKFVIECFNPDGTKIDKEESYPRNPGKNKKNCKYCPHYKTNCTGKSDIEED